MSNFESISLDVLELIERKLSELQVDMSILKGELAETRVKLDNLEATVNHER